MAKYASITARGEGSGHRDGQASWDPTMLELLNWGRRANCRWLPLVAAGSRFLRLRIAPCMGPLSPPLPLPSLPPHCVPSTPPIAAMGFPRSWDILIVGELLTVAQ